MAYRKVEWIDPLTIAKSLNETEDHFVFLHSTMDVSYSGRYSILAWEVDQTCSNQGWGQLEAQLKSSGHRFDRAWFGYLGYGLKHDLEKLPISKSSFIDLPNMMMASFLSILYFDHHLKTCLYYSTKKNFEIPNIKIHQKDQSSVEVSIQSNMSKKEYMSYVQQCLKKIWRGDCFQVNLTRKFFGQAQQQLDSFDLFLRLLRLSPSPYSAFLKYPDVSVISSSPERFVKISTDGKMTSSPIKGSAQRSTDSKEDQILKDRFTKSEKDRSENLMIVDLMRHDFSRSCVPGSVKVSSLFDVTTFSNIHHMSSTIVGQKRNSVSSLDAVKACFPPGSMTGTPKIYAMSCSSAMEKIERGVYSGALGWFGGDGSVDLSVVIRTLVCQKNRFEFQVGGAIVADSDPEKEWKETLIKAKSLAEVLGLNFDRDLTF